MAPPGHTHQHPELADLLAWQAGELNTGAAQTIAAHVHTCAACRQQLADTQRLRELLRRDTPINIPPDDPGLARARALIYEPAPRGRTPRWQRLAPLAAVVLVLAIGVGYVVQRTPQTEAGRGISVILRLQPRYDPVFRSDAAGLPGSPVPLVVNTSVPGVSFAAQLLAPETLPLGLERTGMGTYSAKSAGASYANDAGLILQLVQEITTTDLDFPTNNADVKMVHNTEVLLTFDAPDRVNMAMWDADGVRFALMVLQSPADGFTGAQTTEVVSAILTADAIPAHDP